ncbi:hypothetical protein [Avibacterium paragallinarum]|uniref:Uncharacterized protein n=1 Tax=Avibacterium paragallinarum TaxID=728 RepID=A0AAE5TJV9_AVIPA|nr:hypothetical protein [Avibacterium paragallinarum]MEE3608286.1 hypothetical protein [Avibacterium paragallinarum]MEE3620791.1 hypothetical protein [Avibacterium paragallinarum]MEE3668092.1 hypothetical protein [Avibacterium paragallinarum]MEE3681364.1 hypothetical protein [Avibacterium paragallinarum]MEE4385896.1 hypothetical protein [Avibacterium paragallinarum]
MEIILPNNKVLRGDLTPLVIKRTDLTAVPSTLECLIRVDNELNEFIQEGEIISLAEKDVKYRIIATSKQGDGIRTQGNPDYTLTKVIAILDSCHQIAFAKQKAIIKENTNFSTIYRACGATIGVSKDIKVRRFSCYIGSPPSFQIQQALQREAATIVWDGKQTIAFTRLLDLFEQPPKEILQQDCTQEFISGFVERHEIPAYYSNTENGDVITSTTKLGRGADFAMFADKQILNNLSTYLIQRKVWTTRLTPNINAGDIIEVEHKKYVIITATHLFSQFDAGSGSQLSRFWLGELSNMVNKTK